MRQMTLICSRIESDHSGTGSERPRRLDSAGESPAVAVFEMNSLQRLFRQWQGTTGRHAGH